MLECKKCGRLFEPDDLYSTINRHCLICQSKAKSKLYESCRLIGKKIFLELDEDDQALIRFGMTPKRLMDVFNNELSHKLIRAQYPDVSEDEEAELNRCLKKDLIAKCEHIFILGLMEGAGENGGMVV